MSEITPSYAPSVIEKKPWSEEDLIAGKGSKIYDLKTLEQYFYGLSPDKELENYKPERHYESDTYEVKLYNIKEDLLAVYEHFMLEKRKKSVTGKDKDSIEGHLTSEVQKNDGYQIQELYLLQNEFRRAMGVYLSEIKNEQYIPVEPRNKNETNRVKAKRKQQKALRNVQRSRIDTMLKKLKIDYSFVDSNLKYIFREENGKENEVQQDEIREKNVDDALMILENSKMIARVEKTFHQRISQYFIHIISENDVLEDTTDMQDGEINQEEDKKLIKKPVLSDHEFRLAIAMYLQEVKEVQYIPTPHQSKDNSKRGRELRERFEKRMDELRREQFIGIETMLKQLKIDFSCIDGSLKFIFQDSKGVEAAIYQDELMEKDMTDMLSILKDSLELEPLKITFKKKLSMFEKLIDEKNRRVTTPHGTKNTSTEKV